MSERERPRPERPAPAGGNGAPTPEGSARTDVEALLRRADDVIARALSGDSERFLDATRQSGGQ